MNRPSVRKKSHKEVVTYDLMEKYISIMPDAASHMKEYENVKLKSHAFRSPYKYVMNWFETKYSNYGKFMVKDEKGKVVWDIVALYKQAAEQKKAKKQEHPPETESFLEEAAS